MRRFIILAFGLITIAACKRENPQEFNATINNINDSIKIKGEAWGDAFGDAMNTLAFAGLKPAREDIERYVDAAIKRVENLGNVKGSKELKEAELEYLRYEKQTVHDVFMPFENFNAQTTYGELEQAANALAVASQQEQGRLDKVRLAQQQYLTKNNITAQ